MLRYHFSLFFLLGTLSVACTEAKETFIRPQKLSKLDSNNFKRAFSNSWRELQLDEIEYEDGKTIKAKSYSGSLPVKLLSGKCLGRSIYIFDLAGFNTIDKNGSLFNVGVGYTGSAGTRNIIFSVENDRLSVLYDANVIEVLGVSNRKSNMKGCPDISIVLSGSNFRESKNNYDYREVKLQYNISKKQYLREP